MGNILVVGWFFKLTSMTPHPLLTRELSGLNLVLDAGCWRSVTPAHGTPIPRTFSGGHCGCRNQRKGHGHPEKRKPAQVYKKLSLQRAKHVVGAQKCRLNLKQHEEFKIPLPRVLFGPVALLLRAPLFPKQVSLRQAAAPSVPPPPSYTGGTFSVHLPISTLAFQTTLSEDPTQLATAKEGAGFAVPRPECASRWTEAGPGF